MANDDVYENAPPPIAGQVEISCPLPVLNPWRLIKSSSVQMARLLFSPQTIYLKHV